MNYSNSNAKLPNDNTPYPVASITKLFTVSFHASCHYSDSLEKLAKAELQNLHIFSPLLQLRDIGTGVTGGTCPQDFAKNKEVPFFMFKNFPYSLIKKRP